MSEHETPDDPVQAFAAELRQLRQQAGSPSFRHMAGQAFFSSSTLAEAVQGRRLPSRQVVEAFARACGAEPAQWVANWQTASARLAGTDRSGPPAGAAAVAPLTGPAAADAACSAPAGTSPGQRPLALSRADASVISSAGFPARRRPRRSWLAGVLGAAFLVSGTGAWLMAAPGSGTTAGAATAVQPIADGEDPYAHGCARDQQPMERQPIYRANGKLYGWVILYVSASCSAAWGYVLGPNSPQWRVDIMAHRIEDNAEAPSSFQGQARSNSWGNALSTRSGCVRAEAWVDSGPRAITSCWHLAGPVVRPAERAASG